MVEIDLKTRVGTLAESQKSFYSFTTNIFAKSFPNFIGGSYIENSCNYLSKYDRTMKIAARSHFKSTSLYDYVMFNIMFRGIKEDLDIRYFSYNERLACYDNKTEVLTKHGFKNIAEINEGEEIATRAEHGEIRFDSVQKKFEYPYSGKMISFKNQHLDLFVTPNHKIFVSGGHGDKRIRGHLRDLRELLPIIRKTKFGTSRWMTSYGVWRGKQFRKNKDTLRLMSWYITEGNLLKYKSRISKKGKISYGYRVLISQSEKSTYFEEICELLKRLKIKYTYNQKARQFFFTSKKWYFFLKDCGKTSGNKLIPGWIKELNSKALEIFFEVLIKGDGNLRISEKLKRESYAYYTISKQLADDVQEIAFKIGLRSQISTKKGGKAVIRGKEYQTKDSFIVYCSKGKKSYFRKDQISEISYKGKVYCVEVPSHILLVRRNGKIIWSGNSWHIQQIRSLIEKNPYFKEITNLKPIAENIGAYTWDRKHIVRIRPVGIVSFSRGSKSDILLLDDILSDPANPIHPTIILKINQIFRSVILESLKPGGEIHIVGSPISLADLYFDPELQKEFHTTFSPGIIKDKDGNEVPVWPEFYTLEKLKSKLAIMGEKAFSAEIMCEPFYSTDAFFKKENLRKTIVNKQLRNIPLNTGLDTRNLVIAGLDIGRKKHKSALNIFEVKDGKAIHIHRKIMKGWRYFTAKPYDPLNPSQVEYCKIAIKNFGIDKLYYDDTRGEFMGAADSEILTPHFIPIVFTHKGKVEMASSLEKIFGNSQIEIFDDEDLLNSLCSVTNDLQKIESVGEHADDWDSIGLAMIGFNQFIMSGRQDKGIRAGSPSVFDKEKPPKGW